MISLTKDHQPQWRREGNVLFNDALDTIFTAIWLSNIQTAREDTRCRHYMVGYFLLVAQTG